MKKNTKAYDCTIHQCFTVHPIRYCSFLLYPSHGGCRLPSFQFSRRWTGMGRRDRLDSLYNENRMKTELTSNGLGGYSGLSYPGQTFYYSRILTEEAESPVLKIEAVNRTVSVFLDDTLIYTDCPELNNQIGSLTLPMLEYDRMEPITISLPPDYLGKTLTIAQSSPVMSETLTDAGAVWPSVVTLYCGYAYESSLIASAAKTMIPVALLLSLELFLLGAFVLRSFSGILSVRLPVFALAVLLQICSTLTKADFFFQYFQEQPFDLSFFCFHLSIGILLLFLALCASEIRFVYLALAALQWISTLLSAMTQMKWLFPYGDSYVFFMELPKITGFLSLLVMFFGAIILWKLGNRFFRHLVQTSLVLSISYAFFLLVSIPFLPDYAASVFTKITGDIKLLLPNFSLTLVWYLSVISSLVAVMLDISEQETERRTERKVLEAKNKLAMESYENLRCQAEEVNMLRHDTMKHYSLLRELSVHTPERVPGYLDELIGQAKKVRSVVISRNQTLNILLNGTI